MPAGVVDDFAAPGPLLPIAVAHGLLVDVLPHAHDLIVALGDKAGAVGLGHLVPGAEAAGGIADLGGGASDNADGAVAVQVHPEQGHQRHQGHQGEEVAEVEGGGGRVDADIGANALKPHKLADLVIGAGHVLDEPTGLEQVPEMRLLAIGDLLGPGIPGLGGRTSLGQGAEVLINDTVHLPITIISTYSLE